MKVAIITRYFLPVMGGIENHCYNLAKELLRKGIIVEVHTSKDTLTERNVLKRYEVTDGIKVFRHKSFWKFTPAGYDIIHLHNFNIFPHFWIFMKILIKKLLRIRREKLIVTLHGGFTPWWKGFPLLHRIVKFIYHKTVGRLFLNHVADKIIAISTFEKNELIKEGINEKKIVVIPNGIEDKAYSTPEKEEPYLNKYKPYILFIGRISRLKNLEFAIKCVKEANTNLLIIGPIHEKDYYEFLKNLIAKMNMQKRVFYLGEIVNEYKYKFIDNALAIILVSRHEAEPLSVKEAMTRGKPVIVSNIPALTHIIHDGENGFIVSDEMECADKIKKLISDEELRIKISNNNKIKAEKWRWNVIVKKIIQIYSG